MTPFAPPSSRPARCLRLLAAAALAGAPLAAQSWVQRTLSVHPAARSRTPLAYDVHRGMTTLFGGQDAASAPRNDTWEFDGTAWIPRAPGVQPSARWGHSMAFDSKRGVVVLVGGFNGLTSFADTWEWNGTTWTQRSGLPPAYARSSAGMAYDSVRGVCVLACGAPNASTAAADVWEYNGSFWAQRSGSGPFLPRRNVSMAFDEVRRETLLFGGVNGAGTTLYGDLWSWNGTTWTQRSNSGPSARRDAAMAFDGNCGRAVLFGGYGTNFQSDSWAWDGASWTPLGTVPSATIAAPGLAHDAQRGQFVLLYGNATGAPGNTWELGASCSRAMTTIASPVVGQTAQFRYAYPGVAGNLHFCWTLITPRQPLALPVPIPGFASIGRCRVDLLTQLAAPATFLDGSGALTTALSIPNNLAFSGFQFDVQSVDLDLFTNTLRWAANDVEATVGPTAPAAAFTATPTIGSAPLTVSFTDASTENPTSWQWDFDNDGTIDSTQQNPSWTYTSNGVYSVRLVATNVVGSGTVTRSQLIAVGFPGPSPGTQPNMVPIAPGTFQMGSTAGSSNEQPVHQVTLSAPFWMSKYEVTQAEYQAVVGSNPSFFQGASAPNAPQRPVETVSWNDALAYCQALTVSEQAAGRVPAGYRYQLPTEAEWEYCCRAGTTTEWSTGTSLSTSQANFQGALANSTHPAGQTAAVGSYAPNAFGLHDMHGNVLEWCLDANAPYAPGPVTDPFVTGGGKVARGGNWGSGYTAPDCTSAVRLPGFTESRVGFRVVLAPVRPTPFVNLVAITPGTFQMGSTAGQSNEQPVHQVTLSYPFWIGKYEVKQTEYQSVMGSNPSSFQGASAPNWPQRPVETVSWNSAVAYGQALTAIEQAAGRLPPGYQYRLPTEAEWEYCCRAGTTTEWHTGTSLSTSQANFAGALANATNTSGQTAVVGTYAPNAFGLHDMHGNVWEWCLDSFATYAAGPVTDPFVTGGSNRVLRGGGWFSSNSATVCRSAYRGSTLPTITAMIYGFRVVLAPVLVP